MVQSSIVHGAETSAEIGSKVSEKTIAHLVAIFRLGDPSELKRYFSFLLIEPTSLGGKDIGVSGEPSYSRHGIPIE